MTRREVQFLWVGLVAGFVFGVVLTIIGLADPGVPRRITSWAGGRAGIGVISPYYFGRY